MATGFASHGTTAICSMAASRHYLAARAIGIYYVASTDWEFMARLLQQTEEEDLDVLLHRPRRPASAGRLRSRTPPRLEPSKNDVLLASIANDWKEVEVVGWPVSGPAMGYYPCQYLQDESTRGLGSP